jgi:hypothetical protein
VDAKTWRRVGAVREPPLLTKTGARVASNGISVEWLIWSLKSGA